MEYSSNNSKPERPGIRYGKSYNLTIFLIIILLNWADQNIFSPKLNDLMADFNLTTTAPLGVISSLFMAFSAIGMVIFGYLADKTTRKWITVFSSFFYAVFTLLAAFTPDGRSGYYYLLFMRLCSGFGLGAVVPSIFSMLADMAPTDKRAFIMALFSIASVIGQMAGLAVASSIPEWRKSYFYIGIAELIFAFFLFGIREPKRGESEDEIREALLLGAEYKFTFKKEDFKLLMANKSNKWIILNFIDTIPSSMLIFVIFKYFRDVHNISEDKTTLFILFGVISGILGALLFGHLGDKWYKKNKRIRATLAIFCNNAPIIFYLLFFIPFISDFRANGDEDFGQLIQYGPVKLILFIITISLFINQGVGPNWYSSVIDINLPEHRATMLSIASFADLIGKSLGPFLGGLMMDAWGPQAAMGAVAIFWAANTAFWIPIYKHIVEDIENTKRIIKERLNLEGLK